MGDTQAMPVDAITGVEATDDGKHALVHIKYEGGEYTIAFSFDTLIPLMQSLSTAFENCRKAQNISQDTKHVLPLEWWHFWTGPDDTVVLSFRMPGGMEMTYQVHKEVVPQMKDALTAAAGGAVEFPPGTQKQ